jgi:hypothetical protein
MRSRATQTTLSPLRGKAENDPLIAHSRLNAGYSQRTFTSLFRPADSINDRIHVPFAEVPYFITVRPVSGSVHQCAIHPR